MGKCKVGPEEARRTCCAWRLLGRLPPYLHVFEAIQDEVDPRFPQLEHCTPLRDNCCTSGWERTGEW